MSDEQSLYKRLLGLPRELLIEIIMFQQPVITITPIYSSYFKQRTYFRLNIRYPDGTEIYCEFALHLSEARDFVSRLFQPMSPNICEFYGLYHIYEDDTEFVFTVSSQGLRINSLNKLTLSKTVTDRIGQQMQAIVDDWTAHPDKYPIKGH